MNNEQKQAMIDVIRGLVSEHDDQASIEAYTKHYFWPYYIRRLERGLPWSLDEFWDTIPEKCRVPAAQRRREHAEKHNCLYGVLNGRDIPNVKKIKKN